MTNPYLDWKKPKKFDYNLIVIGGGSAGLVSSYIASAVKAKVALIEQHAMGGDCLNSGCVPSKALISSTRFLALTRHPQSYGVTNMTVEYSFADIMAHVQKVINTIAPHDSVARYEGLGVDVFKGHAKLISPWAVQVTSSENVITLTSLAIILACGAKPLIPPIPGIDSIGYLTSDTVWQLRQQPQHMLILGGGAIGCELAQCFMRLGSQVTLIEMASRLLVKEDDDVSALVLERFKKEGITVLLNHKAERFINTPNKKILTVSHNGQTHELTFDTVLLALGRKPSVTGYGLEEIGVMLSPKGTVQIDAFQATNYPHIFACGDVAGPYQFTHTAAHQAWYAAVNGLFGCFKKFRTDYSIIPWATFTEPEIARVGLNERDAKSQGIAYEVSRYDIADLDRAITDASAYGFVKVLTKPGKDSILGVTIAGNHAGDLIAEFVLAMKHNIGLNKILGTIHIYPTYAEANKYAAGNWRKQHQPKMLLRLAEQFHKWQRS